MIDFSRLFSMGNLMQASTIKAIIGVAVASGLVALSPTDQEKAANLVMRVLASAMNLLAAGQAAYAFVNFLHDERKSTIVTTAPVTITTPTTITTEPKG